MSQKPKFHIQELILCAMFAALIAIGAFIKIPLGPVPMTLQFLFTNLASLLLGRRLGTISVLVYIAVGLVGVPIFTMGGGPGYIFQPTFGYMIGFAAGAWVAGTIVGRSQTPGMRTYLLAGFVNMLVMYAVGVPYYWLIATYYLGSAIGAGALLISGCLIFLPNDILAFVIGAALAKRLRPALSSHLAYNNEAKMHDET